MINILSDLFLYMFSWLIFTYVEMCYEPHFDQLSSIDSKLMIIFLN